MYCDVLHTQKASLCVHKMECKNLDFMITKLLFKEKYILKSPKNSSKTHLYLLNSLFAFSQIQI